VSVNRGKKKKSFGGKLFGSLVVFPCWGGTKSLFDGAAGHGAGFK